MNEESDLQYVIFGSRPKVGDFELVPLHAPRVAILQEVKNPIFMGEVPDGADIGSFPVAEILFVATRTPRELAEAIESGEWRVLVREFVLDLDDQTLVDAWAVIEAESKALQNAQAAPKKKKIAKKKVRRKR